VKKTLKRMVVKKYEGTDKERLIKKFVDSGFLDQSIVFKNF
jgi:hypothetical protein